MGAASETRYLNVDFCSKRDLQQRVGRFGRKVLVLFGAGRRFSAHVEIARGEPLALAALNLTVDIGDLMPYPTPWS